VRAFSRVGGKVRISLPVDIETEHTGSDPVRWSVIVGRGEYEELRDQILDGDPVRAELKRSLDEAMRRIEQLTDERDRMTAQRDEAVRKAALVDAARPIRMTMPAELFAVPVDDELKAVIVSQAREIARLKGESE